MKVMRGFLAVTKVCSDHVLVWDIGLQIIGSNSLKKSQQEYFTALK